MALIVISDPVYFKDECDLINQLFDAGMSIFHLRKPDSDQSSYEKLISEIDVRFHERIALHQFHELRTIFPLIKRLHYPEQLRKISFESDFKKLHGYTLSTSIHQLHDLKMLKNFSYTFYGPVFNSISKLGYTGLPKARLVIPSHCSTTKIIGLGGITHEKVREIMRMNFDGMAVLGTIWNNKTTSINNFKQLSIKHKEHFI